MAKAALSSKNVGDIVQLKENGMLTDFIIVHKGRPASLYESSCDGIWLLRKEIYSNEKFDAYISYNDRQKNDYENSDIQSWLENTYYSYFEEDVKTAIKQVKIPFKKGAGNASGGVINGTDGLPCHCFFLSSAELGISRASHEAPGGIGAKLSYFTAGADGNADRIAKFNNTAVEWWTRSPDSETDYFVVMVGTDGGDSLRNASDAYGVRPAFILSESLFVSDDGEITANQAPAQPEGITLPEIISKGARITVSWGASTDEENNLAGYELERQHDNGEWNQIYKGNARTCMDSIAKGWGSVAYRVRAYDTENACSGYTVSETRTVSENAPPAIVCDIPDGSDLGEKAEGFTLPYCVVDDNGDAVTVVEKVDTDIIRSFQPALDAENTFCLTGEAFLRLGNGTYELSISVDDGIEEISHNLTFTKLVAGASITLKEPMVAESRITSCALSVTGSIPADAEYKAEVTNNAKDSSPAWEECTSAVQNGTIHMFANQTAKNGYAFNFRFSIKRGESEEGGYISSIQGGFQS